MLIQLVRGFLSACMLAIGTTAFLSAENVYIGALLFTIGLYLIVKLNLSLFTGMVGFIVEKHKKNDIHNLIFALIGNIIGCIVFGTILHFGFNDISDKASILAQTKLMQKPYQTLIRGFLCGVLMFCAVHIFKTRNSVIGIFLCVPTFILSGFEHCLADLITFAISFNYTLNSLLFIVLVIVGNVLGSVFVPLCEYLLKDKKYEES